MNERKLFKLLERIAVALEKSAGIESPTKPVVPAEPITASVVRPRRRLLHEDGPDDRGLTKGGVPPAIFFSRRERD